MVCGIFAFIGTSASAEWGWYECTVSKAGVGGPRYEVNLSGSGIKGTSGTVSGWFEFHPEVQSQANVMIANILTAISMDYKVEVLLDPEITQSLYAVYLLPN